MAINTTFRPLNEADFNSNAMQINIQSVSIAVSPGEIKNCDLQLSDDHLLQGVEKLLVYGADKDDTVTLQVVHPVVGVISQFCTNFFVDPSTANQQISIPSYVAKIPAGLIIRLVYKASASTGTRDVRLNWLLHKVLL